nr:hypothetical protein [Chloroflexaceae bacterium]
MATQSWEQTEPLARRWGYTLAAELRFVFAALSAPPLYMALALLVLALLLIPQLPLRYRIDVGLGEGYGGDLPMLQGFNTPERDSHGSFRWTADGAKIHMVGLGQRPLRVQLDFFPISDEVVQAGPKSLDILANGQPLVTLPVFKAGSQQSFVVPPRLLANGDLTLTLRTETFAPPGDPRRLGTPLDRITVTALNNGGFVAPDWHSLTTWLLALAMGWLVLCRAVGQTGDRRPETGDRRRESIRKGRKACPELVEGEREGETQYAVCSTQYAVLGAKGSWFLVLGSCLIALAATLDPLRWAAGAQAALLALAWGYGLALLLHWLLPGLAARLAVPLSGRALGVLALICVGAFAMRYGGRLYPESMPGDIGFHTNRFGELVRGLVHILSRNRGVDFPYPPGPYLLLAPVTLLGVSIPTLLQF